MNAIPPVSLADIDAEIASRKRNKFTQIFPETGPLQRQNYVRHMEFFEAGLKFRQRLFRAANRSGKTEAGAFEVTCHLTGQYPKWWVGKRFSRPTQGIAAGETSVLTRDSIQFKLLGKPEAIGTGMIPYDCILERRSKSGIADGCDTVKVKHSSGGISTLNFKSFDQGREVFQATEQDFIWLDEEPPLDVYTECITRTMTTGGVVMTTFTPLRGMSDTVQFLQEKAKEGNVHVTTATWDDAPHLNAEAKTEMLAAYPPHQRDARSKGIPALGSGAIYPVPETEIICAPFEIPVFWRRSYAMDVGWNRTAALWQAWDEETDIVYIYSEYYRGQAEPSVHADSINSRGKEINGVIDPAARGRSQKDGEQLLWLYQQLGLKLTLANNSVEAGIYKVYQRLSSGRMKVFSTCQNWLTEWRMYRRDEKGNIVKENDHLMDCARYLIMSGLDVSNMVDEYRDTLRGIPVHQINYNALAPIYIEQDVASNHTFDYNPLKG